MVFRIFRNCLNRGKSAVSGFIQVGEPISNRTQLFLFRWTIALLVKVAKKRQAFIEFLLHVPQCGLVHNALDFISLVLKRILNRWKTVTAWVVSACCKRLERSLLGRVDGKIYFSSFSAEFVSAFNSIVEAGWSSASRCLTPGCSTSGI